MIERPEEFEVQFANRKTGATEILKIAGSQEISRKKFWKDWYRSEDGPPLKMKFMEQPGVAVITVQTFNQGRAKQFRQNFDQTSDAFFLRS